MLRICSPHILILLLNLLVIQVCQVMAIRFTFFCEENKPYYKGEDVILEVGKAVVLSYFYDRKTDQCYRGNRRGPCSIYMLLTSSTSTSDEGTCTCLSLRGPRCGTKFNKPIARAKADSLCYPVYDQGPCEKGEWFTQDGVCTPNPCLKLKTPKVNLHLFEISRKYYYGQEYYSRDYISKNWTPKPPEGVHPWAVDSPGWYLYEGKCYLTYTQGHCGGKEQLAIFHGTGAIPKCDNTTVQDGRSVYCSQFGIVLSKLHCASGFRQHGSDCVPDLQQKFEEDDY